MLEYTIPENPENPYRTGRHVKHDPQSRNFRVAMAADIQPQDWVRKVPIFDQGNLGSCTGNAAAGSIATNWNAGQGLTTVQTVLNGPKAIIDEAVAVDIYSKATALDDYKGTYPPIDTGSDGLSVAKVLKNAGVISEYQHGFGLADLEAALQTGPAIIGTNWYTNMFYPKNGVVTIGGQVEGGHEYCAVAINPLTQLITFANSWGTDWANEGYFQMSYSTVDRLLSEDGDVTVFRPVLGSAPVPPTPFPSTGTVQLDADIIALAQSRADRSKLSLDQWVNKRIRSYLHI